MSFRADPPKPFVPKPDKTIAYIILIVTFIIIIVIFIITYFAVRRTLDIPCKTNFDCSSPTSICNRENGTCIECKSSSDCGTGLICSTANTCV